ncbi:DUF2147 domain-containing protein [Roseixanthobacter pseudopolyaromaticivorans]|uniref:DUF2147 domain-containing protein n=1 Tax=Xanthobacteraceae TaxID=335928 RepID=UPI003726F4DA
MRRLIAAALLLASVSGVAAAPDISGVWLTDDGEAAVDLHLCGTTLCGHIVWLKTPRDEAGLPVRDEDNADETLRGRPLCGVEVIAGLAPQGDGWEGGWIYDPERGARYSAAIQQNGKDSLAVTGFVGVKALGRTLVWSRAPAVLPRCDGAAGKGEH